MLSFQQEPSSLRQIVNMLATSNLATLAVLCNVAIANSQIGVSSLAGLSQKIKNVVVLVEENRSFDTFGGGFTYNPSIDGLLHHNYCNSM